MDKILYYTGIGSREAPEKALGRCTTWAITLAKMGFILRSGGAHGCDLAFETGCDLASGKKEIYLPWAGFNRSKSNLYDVRIKEHSALAAEVYGSHWPLIPPSVHRLMIRNLYQVAGANLDTPSEFVLCWTPDGCEDAECRNSATGGTGQAIAYASKLEVPVFNLKVREEEELVAYVSEKYGGGVNG